MVKYLRYFVFLLVVVFAFLSFGHIEFPYKRMIFYILIFLLILDFLISKIRRE